MENEQPTTWYEPNMFERQRSDLKPASALPSDVMADWLKSVLTLSKGQSRSGAVFEIVLEDGEERSMSAVLLALRTGDLIAFCRGDVGPQFKINPKFWEGLPNMVAYSILLGGSLDQHPFGFDQDNGDFGPHAGQFVRFRGRDVPDWLRAAERYQFEPTDHVARRVVLEALKTHPDWSRSQIYEHVQNTTIKAGRKRLDALLDEFDHERERRGRPVKA